MLALTYYSRWGVNVRAGSLQLQAKGVPGQMDHDAAKAALFNAEGQSQRTEAVAQALELGMSLTQIQEYLDWVDAARAAATARPKTSWLAWLANRLGFGKAEGGLPSGLAPDRTQTAPSQTRPPTKPR